ELFCGTHNEESCKLLAEAIEANGLRPTDHRIFFAQLLGMSDNITFNLADAGYNTTKYVPYAPVEKVLPYLLRRMQENSSVAGQTGRELRMLKSEITRRKRAGKEVLENKPV
ncbi:MAG: proline dehydrogenase family protein, partial [Tannerellaceae bacterium]